MAHIDDHLCDVDEEMLWNDAPDFKYAHVVCWPMTNARLAGNLNPIFEVMSEKWETMREVFSTDVGHMEYPIIYCNIEVSDMAMYERLFTGKSQTSDAILFTSECPFYEG